jgi:hypothetical protein
MTPITFIVVAEPAGDLVLELTALKLLRVT